MKPKYSLTQEEIDIENNADIMIPVSKIKRAKINNIIDAAKKNKSINVEIVNYDLAKLKEIAHNEGIPYQTLITNILHKYITNQFYEKHEVIKSIQLLQEHNAGF